ncbi:hypothetical protein L1S32_03710 [Methanogenium sp. S4BF]|uniref:hypothetical protein n=1 Tax=Methanogenium sp. S4BF TaxID=1789226 RepID=UPI0024166564|nr:hypothetical protein [Methanogenium sp. S4BF]WFN35238.1 hypothetical protein L1S32_03710 [Methanogenium sp. S4BF]
MKFEKEICHFTPFDGEKVAVFSQDGKLIKEFEAEYNLNRELITEIPVEFDSELSGNILTHNHPSGTSFGKNDLMTASSIQLQEIRVVGKCGLYSMKPKGNMWPISEDMGNYFDAINTNSKFQSELNDIQFSADFYLNSKDIYLDMLRIKSELRCEKIAGAFGLDYKKSSWG